ncbi:ORF6N domain-containing protein [Pseudomonas sp. NY5710]|uniref:ORF6N domain-containing protein n=1 Tax=Pseudomonas sp. NY5710 TaxID=2662033 RepID=UPI00156E020B|nr:ORF6N domain-containing protein [Pseudomonas sp. NY5710]QKL03880.1 ORF6N domain-containing protein [Pseudomonas sp. NY5710]
MNLVTVHNTQLPIVEYRGQRVVTLAMIDQVHERPDGTAGRTFTAHKDRLIEGAGYFFADTSQKDVLRCFGIEVPNRGLILMAEQGYLMLVKPFTDDLSWSVQRQLVSNYFRPAPALPTDYITALEHLLASKRSEQLALEQRDHAIATKAEIGNRREATAMATASAAVRKVKHLENELGRGCQHATVTAVEKAAHRSFGSQGFRPLKNWCDSHGVSAPKVQDPRFGWVRSWPAAAWTAVYQIDLAELFGAAGDHE